MFFSPKKLWFFCRVSYHSTMKMADVSGTVGLNSGDKNSRWVTCVTDCLKKMVMILCPLYSSRVLRVL